MMATSRKTITQINLQHSKAATALLCRSLAAQQADVALIQEPWVYRGHVRGLTGTGGQLFSGLSEEGRPCRAAVWVAQTLVAVQLPQFCSRDQVAVAVEYKSGGDGRRLVFASTYLPYDSELPPPSAEMQALVGYCRAQGLPLVLGCDANAHHVGWGSSNCNARGESLAEYLVGTDMVVINQGNEPTFVVPQRQEVIDISIVSSGLLDEISGWRVLREVSMSDHRYIRFWFQADKSPPVMRRNPKATDWEVYSRSLGLKLDGVEVPDRLESPQQVEDVMDNVYHAVLGSFEEACPLKRRREGKKVPWWSADLHQRRKQVRALQRRALATDEEEDWAVFTAARNEYKGLIRSAKREAWREFCSGVEKTPEAARLQRVLSRESTCQVGLIQMANGEFASSEAEALSQLLGVHFPGCQEQPVCRPPPWPDPAPPSEEAWSLAGRMVQEDRVRWAISAFGPFKTAGLDGIFPALLQKGVGLLAPILCKVYQACLALEYIPLQWRMARVVFIPKPGRPSYDQAKAFRPISLSSFFLKTMERLVDRFLREETLQRLPLHNQQHAYRAGRSTESALHSLVQKIEKSFMKKEFSLGVFLDIEGAFNNAPFESIVDSLVRRKVPPVVARWIGSFLKSQLVCASLGNVSKVVRVKRGFPQGGVLSPLLWDLVADSLLERLNSQGINTQGYADDMAVLVSGLCLSTVCRQVQTGMEIVSDWCEETGLSVNPRKTEMVLFTRRKRRDGFKAPHLGGQELALSREVKFLGVILDSELRWHSHLQYACQKATIALWQCRRAVGKTWGLSPKIMFWLYRFVVRPRVSYAVVVWWPRLELVTAQRRLLKLQRLVCISVTGAMRTTPTAALEVALNLPPLHQFLLREAMAACYRLKKAGVWGRVGTEVGHCRLWSRMVNLFPVVMLPSDRCLPVFNFGKKFEVCFPAREEWGREGSRPAVGPLHIYTDGSRMDGATGAGVFLGEERGSLSVPLGPHATVPQAEVFAILAGVMRLEESGVRGEHIVVCSDSQTALHSLSQPRATSAVVVRCFRAVQRLAESNRVELTWVPAHVGIEGNEAADALAKEAAAVEFIGESEVGVSLSVVKHALHGWLRRQHEADWEAEPGCRQAKSLLGGIDPGQSKLLLRLPRGRLRAVIGALTGHCSLAKHLHTIGVLDDPTCPLCGEEEESALHHLGECVALSYQRIRVLGVDRLRAEDIRRLSVSDLLRLIKSLGRL